MNKKQSLGHVTEVRYRRPHARMTYDMTSGTPHPLPLLYAPYISCNKPNDSPPLQSLGKTRTKFTAIEQYPSNDYIELFEVIHLTDINRK